MQYKSVLVEESCAANSGSSYLATLLDYVHLNPVRAGVVRPARDESILDRPVSSVSCGYALPPSKRPEWLKARLGLQLFGFGDTTRDRRRFVERLDSIAATEAAENCGLAEIEGRRLNSTLRRGWFWGSETFKESMLQRLDGIRAHNGNLPESHSYTGTPQSVDYRTRSAEAIIQEASHHFGFRLGQDGVFPDLARSDIRRVAVAWAIWRTTSVPQKWIAEHLGLRSASNVSQRVRNFDAASSKQLPKVVRSWKKRYAI